MDMAPAVEEDVLVGLDGAKKTGKTTDRDIPTAVTGDRIEEAKMISKTMAATLDLRVGVLVGSEGVDSADEMKIDRIMETEGSSTMTPGKAPASTCRRIKSA